MNLKTTLILLLLVAGGLISWFAFPSLRPDGGAGEPPTILAQELKDALQADRSDQPVRIEVAHADQRVLLERAAGQTTWTLPGQWPTRDPEVNQLVGLLAGLESRFVPLAVEPGQLADYGLADPPVKVTLRAGAHEQVLEFGEEPAPANNPFSRPTYLRVHGNDEVIRLGPGLVAVLKRPPDYYQQRWLFLAPEKQIKDQDHQHGDRFDVVQAITALSREPPADAAKEPGPASYTLTWSGGEWHLTEPVRDRVDPDKLKTILSSVPDIWVEQFQPKGKDLADYGLHEPEQTLRVTKDNGQTVTLLIGKKSGDKTRTVSRPAPPGPPGMPRLPQQEIVHEEYRYAKLQDNDQVFEIKAEKLKDLFVAADTLRDARLARFNTEDARRVELIYAGQELVFAKEKDRWRLQKPLDADAESSKITEVLDKVSGLQARGPEVFDKADPKAHGLDQPAGTIRVTVEESKGEGENKTRKTRTWTLTLGKHDADKAKLHVQVEGWDRVNAVEDSLVPLLKRPALAYRGRRLFDFASSELAKIELHRDGEQSTLEQAQSVWRLTSPVQADTDSSKTSRLVSDLSLLEAVEYVSDAPKPEELGTEYGLAQPALTAKLTFTDEKKPAQTLQVGKQRPGKRDYFAKLESSPSVFAITKEIRDTLDQSALAYRPLQLWQVPPDDVTAVQIEKEGQRFRLTREGQAWQIAEPFTAPAMPDLVKPVTDNLANLRCERYEAHAAKDLATYGLDKPYLRVILTFNREPQASAAKDGEAAKEVAKERVLLIGKPVAADTKARFAKLGDGEAVVVVGEALVGAVDHSALDLLDRKLLALDAKAVSRIQTKGAAGLVTLQRDGDAWRVVESEAGTPFAADGEAVNGVLGIWSNLRAQRFADYGPKADLAAYGLDQPADSVTVTVQPAAGEEPAPKPAEHTLALGKAVAGSAGERYARLDNGPGVLVLGPAAVAELTRTYLGFVDRSVLQLDAAAVTAVQRRLGGESLEIAKRDDGWHFAQPATGHADEATLEELLAQLAKSRAQRVAAYPAKDLKPFGLEEPAAVWTLRLGGADSKPVVLKIGKPADESSGERFAVAEGSTTVAVLPANLSRRLVAPPLHFRDRNLARIADMDRAVLERGPRKAVFAKVDGTWKLTEPLEAEAEHTDLEDFINALARLRADELVADKPPSLKAYGLDRPEARWRFQAGDKEVLSLLIGGREKLKEQGQEKDGPRRYAKLAAGELVFLLDPGLTGRVLGEYRSRTLWAALDAAQVDRLSYQSDRDSFVLEKVDNAWQVTGKPLVKVKPEAVSETLDALARLKAERFLVDKGADLKLYGLEPPQLVVEVQAPSGKRALHIGRQEGGTKRYYARVPEGGRSDVFVVGEADAARIVRGLAEFAQGAAK